MTAPNIRVEIFFTLTGSLSGELGQNFFTLDTSELNGTDTLAPTSGEWVDVTENVMNFTINRGRNKDIDAFQAGTANIQFLNNDRKFDPLNRNSPYFGNIIPMRQIRIFAITDDNTEIQIYQGFVQEWAIQYPDRGRWSNTVAICSDALSILAMQELDEIVASFTDDTSGARITRVLDLPEVNFPIDLRNIDTGDTIFGNTTFGENALQYLQTAERSESGSLFVAKDGKLTFIARNSSVIATNITFTDVNTNLEPDDEFRIGTGSRLVNESFVVGTTPTALRVGANDLPFRNTLIITNSSLSDIYIGFDNSVTVDNGLLIPEGTIATLELSVDNPTSIFAVASGTTNIRLAEVVTVLPRIPYQEIEVDFSTELLFNRIIVSGTSGNDQISEDTDSQEAFQIRTLLRRDLFIRDDSVASDMADFFRGRFSEPDFRFKSFSINISNLTTNKQKQVLDLDLADRLTVEKTPPDTSSNGDPTTIRQFAVVDGISWRWQQGNIFDLTVRVSSGSKIVAFTLDDPVLGILDENRLGV